MQALARSGEFAAAEQVYQQFVTELTDYLVDRRVLLILDNCEQLLEGCAELVESLLEECGGLKILVTSRHPRRLAGEVDWRVPSLETPNPEHLPSGGAERVAAVRRYAAAELFVERAKAAQKTFALTGENAADVARICLRLDGIPLALQLAATRIKALTVKQIAERMDEGFHLLTGGSRTIPRHQTLQATMDWSCQLLSEPERALLSRVSVFAGGWTLEAAEQVCSDVPGNPQGASRNHQPPAFDPRQSCIARESVLDLLSSLVEKSLVLCEDRLEEARYRLLGTIRQYSAERLRESGQEPAVRTQHRNYFVQLAERAEPHLRGAEQQRWLDRLEAEQENLNSALEFAFSIPLLPIRGIPLRIFAALDWPQRSGGSGIPAARPSRGFAGWRRRWNTVRAPPSHCGSGCSSAPACWPWTRGRGSGRTPISKTVSNVRAPWATGLEPLRRCSVWAMSRESRAILNGPEPAAAEPVPVSCVGEAAFSAAWRVGAALDWEQAVAFALEEAIDPCRGL